jgi:hypothetical protein
MKALLQRALVFSTFLGLGFVMTGCVVSIGGGSHGPDRSGPPTVVVRDSADAATIAEIDAVAKLNMDNARTHALGQIAERGTLAVPVQVHLVNVTYRSLSFDNNKTQVLTMIIARPDFCDATRHAIVSQLNKLSFDNNRQHVLQQINERLKTPAAH